MDVDGYGPRVGPRGGGIGRLLEDTRTLSPAGVERAAQGWERHAGSRGAKAAFEDAERAAIDGLAASGRATRWTDMRGQLLGLTEGATALVAWRAEHGEVGERAESALLGAALGLLAGLDIDPRRRRTLLRPMAEALPWLLPDEAST